MIGLTPVALRMDDVGASSKRFEVYARPLPLPGRAALLGDVLFLKFVPPFRAWGPYRELTANEWRTIVEILRRHQGRLTVGVTASWVTWSGRLIPFPKRFPAQATVIAEAVREGLLEVANHGLTHCVLDGNAFRPRPFSGNRSAHREFWDWIPAIRQHDHLERAQRILEEWLGVDVVTFVPPGNVFGDATIDAARALGLKVVSCEAPARRIGGVTVVGNERVRAFHDRDLVLGGAEQLVEIIAKERSRGRYFVFVRDLARCA